MYVSTLYLSVSGVFFFYAPFGMQGNVPVLPIATAPLSATIELSVCVREQHEGEPVKEHIFQIKLVFMILISRICAVQNHCLKKNLYG